ncbi:hypothetical protein HELRODRAFT_182508 [Helobdella robusta]|uniref:Endonuclease/exonuclease/phosphatase domain-containing protein n=1 Tax=Helobdella robusta TaxID=6412 RepID=T1FIA5_HELRO|nr:hypothetical protein HELRODRAFT_182508 [Helobdella robusta]ESN90917.1 hypothetical protein HELRODRAFT_182508 [Helobdella robusta]
MKLCTTLKNTAFDIVRNVYISYLIGDYDLDFHKLNSDNAVADFSNLLSLYNFLPLITSSTRISTSSRSLIDNIFTINLTHHLSGIILSDISDHFPIFAIASKSENSNHAPVKNLRDLTEVSINNINNFLSNQNWNSLTSLNNINDCCSASNTILTHSSDTFIPSFQPKTEKNAGLTITFLT